MTPGFPCFALALAVAGCGRAHSRGSGNPDSGAVGPDGCQGLACDQVSCDGGATTISGKVTAPNGLDPIAGALVYVPTSVPELTPGVQCEVCNDPIGGRPIVSTTTNVDGSFVLANVPATAHVPVIVQKGRFRRQLAVDVTACRDHPLGVDQSRLPRKQSEGDLPRMAVGIGDYDQIECVLRSIGVDDSELTPPSGNGAIHLYDNSGGTPSLEALLDDASRLNAYQLIFINCTNTTFDTYSNQTLVKQNLYNYVRSGGRLYVTDWSYDYMEQLAELAPYVFFDGGGDTIHPQPIKGADWSWSGSTLAATIANADLAQWMKAAGASPNGSVQIEGSWALALSAAQDQSTYPSTTWVHGVAGGVDRPMTITFDYNACGKVLWSSYHTQQPGGGKLGAHAAFPSYCKSTPATMIAQEKILEYLIFEISSCVGPIG